MRVDIHATLPAGATRAQVPEMLQTLLSERFRLSSHLELRPVQVYELLAGEDGVKMREVEPVDEVQTEVPADPDSKPVLGVSFETVDGPVRSWVIPGTIGTRTVTARSRYDRLFTERRTTIIDAARLTMAELATILASNIDEPVLDRTGLAGAYEFEIELPPDASVVRKLLGAGITTTATGTPLTDPTGVSAFTAVEGLGLRLQRRQSPLDVLVVDRIERTPTEN